MSKRSSIDSFFTSKTAKKIKIDDDSKSPAGEYDNHKSYPIPLPSQFPSEITTNPKHTEINSQPDLDLTYHQPLFPSSVAKELYQFLRDEFCWYRVTYQVRGMTINTPRYTTVFGLDDTHEFTTPVFPSSKVVQKGTSQPPLKPMKCSPRPLPGCLTELKRIVEAETGNTYNFCLLNYYKDGTDSISYHSDDESFLGPDPCIASISLGSSRDFLMRHKDNHSIHWKTSLRSGDMVVMKNSTQRKWDHAIPKRKGDIGGRINITFRRAMVPYGTENYYRYNVHDGPYFKWDVQQEFMVLGSTWKPFIPLNPKLPDGTSIEGKTEQEKERREHLKLVQEESFDVEASIRAIDAANDKLAKENGTQGEAQTRIVSAPKLEPHDSDDLAAQIRAIDEAVARANPVTS